MNPQHTKNDVRDTLKAGAYQRVAGFIDVIEAHIAHPRVDHPPTPILQRSNQLVRLSVLLLGRECFDSHEVLQDNVGTLSVGDFSTSPSRIMCNFGNSNHQSTDVGDGRRSLAGDEAIG